MYSTGLITKVATVSDVVVISGITTLSGFNPCLNEITAKIREKTAIIKKLDKLETSATLISKIMFTEEFESFKIINVMTPKMKCIKKATIST
jgi:hypothetical protein